MPSSRIARRQAVAFGFATVALGLGSPAAAQQDAFQSALTIRDTFGEVGLLEMPSGRMAPDGELDFSFGDVGHQQRYSLNFQALPWLEASFRYSHALGLFNGDPRFYDRSFALKARLLKEDDLWPDLSVGIRDLLGTGVFGAEYVVASKHLGPFDVTGGLGWGQLAERRGAGNPLGVFISRLRTRPVNDYGVGGIPSFKVFFRGPVGAFGGLSWQTPVDGLTVLAEYSSMEYKNYVYAGGLKTRSPVNIGIAYQPIRSITATAGWFYGSTFGLTLSAHGDTTSTYPSALRVGAPPVPAPALRSDTDRQQALTILQRWNSRIAAVPHGGRWVDVPSPAERVRQDMLQRLVNGARGVRNVELRGNALIIDAHVEGNGKTECVRYARIASLGGASQTTIALSDLQDPSGAVTFCPVKDDAPSAAEPRSVRVDDDKLYEKIEGDLNIQSLQSDAIWATTTELWVYYENYRYRREDEAIGRVLRVLLADAPSSIEIFHIVPVDLGVPQQEVVLARSAVERAIGAETGATAIRDEISLRAAPINAPEFSRQALKLYPLFSWGLDPKLTQHVFDPDAPIQFMVYGDATGLLQLAPGLMLATEWTGTIWSNYNYSRDAGSSLPHVRTDLLKYLKQGKYGMSGLQLIYRDRLAPNLFTELRGGYLEDMFMGVGGQILWRPEGSRFAFGADAYQAWKRDFNRLFGIQDYNVATGHISAYYESPWYGLNFAVHAGRYLAGDWGGTFEITRQFDTGIEIGAWATFTDVPFRKFGEGSFDKGIIVHIPFDWGIPIQTQSSYDLRLNSLTRDGGQRLAGDDSLYAVTRRTSYREIAGHFDDIVEP